MKKFVRLTVTVCIAIISGNTVAEMRELQTSVLHNYDHPEIVIKFDDQFDVEDDIQVILASFEEAVSTGTVYKDGQTLQLGPMLNKFSKMDDGRIQLLEPDMTSWPIKYTPGLSKSMHYLRQQKFVVESFNESLAMSFPLIVSAMFVHKDYKTLDKLVLRRVKGQGRVTGWWLFPAAGKGEDSNYIGVSIYELAQNRPDLIKYLALPEGTLMRISNGVFDQGRVGASRLTVKDGSYLATLE